MTVSPRLVFDVWVTNELVARFVYRPDAEVYRQTLVGRILDEAPDLDRGVVERLVQVVLAPTGPTAEEANSRGEDAR